MLAKNHFPIFAGWAVAFIFKRLIKINLPELGMRISAFVRGAVAPGNQNSMTARRAATLKGFPHFVNTLEYGCAELSMTAVLAGIDRQSGQLWAAPV